MSTIIPPSPKKVKMKRRYTIGPDMNPTWIALVPGAPEFSGTRQCFPRHSSRRPASSGGATSRASSVGETQVILQWKKGNLFRWNDIIYIYNIYAMVRWMIHAWLVDIDMYQRLRGWWICTCFLFWVEGIVLVYHSLDLASSGIENRISSSDGVGWQCTAATVVDHLCRQLRWRKA